MGHAVAIRRPDHSASDLRAASDLAGGVRAGCRMLVLDRADRTAAARHCGMDRWTLRNRVHRDNAEEAR